ncbi:MAG: OmpA family protein [Muribaculaceae bacterium]|nr:OmpA family protein [Muribaculaceae bacterium]
MANKVRVYGKAQNRTSLGIMHAYMVMYPQATLEDLRKAFPNSLATDNGTGQIFIYADEKGTNADWDGYFKAPEEVLTDGDGKKVAVNKMWTKKSFENLQNHASQYGIEVAKFEEADKGFGKKGGFRLEYLNGYVPPVREEKKKGLPWWLWLLLGLIAAAAIVALCLPRGEKVVEKEVIVEKEVVVRDTVYVAQIEDIEKNFNAAQFEKGKADLNDDAKLALHDLAKVMKQNPDLKLNIEGHTSSEGDADSNQMLSEKRAQAAVDFLVNKEGIDASRLKAVGMGSSKPIDETNLEANRRTEFVIVE